VSFIPCTVHACRVRQPRKRLHTISALCSCCRVLRVFVVQWTFSFHRSLPILPPLCLARFSLFLFVVSASVLFVVGKSSYALCSLLLLHSVRRVVFIFNYLSPLGTSAAVFRSFAVHSDGLPLPVILAASPSYVRLMSFPKSLLILFHDCRVHVPFVQVLLVSPSEPQASWVLQVSCSLLVFSFFVSCWRNTGPCLLENLLFTRSLPSFPGHIFTPCFALFVA
jgi:hypothetical protein